MKVDIKAPAVRRQRLFDLLAAALIFLFSTALVYGFARIGFDPHHTGMMYKTALDVAHGKVIFRDTFSQYGALSALLQAAAIRLLGERVTSVLFSAAFFYGLNFVLFFYLARRFFGRTCAVLFTGLLLLLAPFFLQQGYLWMFHPWSSIYALFFLLLTVLLLWQGEQKRNLFWPAAAGFSALLAFWCRAPVGLVCLLGAGLCQPVLWLFSNPKTRVAERRYRLLSVGAILGGGALGFLIFFIPLAALGAAHDFVRQNLVSMATMAASRSQNGGVFGMLLYRLLIAPLVEWGAPWMNVMWVLLPLSSLALFGLSCHDVRRTDAKGDGEARKSAAYRLILAVLAVASWHQYYPVSCYRHWYWAAFPSVLSALLLICRFVRYLGQKHAWRPLWRRSLACLFVLLVFGASVGCRVHDGVVRAADATGYTRFENAHYHHLDGLYLNPSMAQYYKELFDDAALLHDCFPGVNVVNTTENAVNALFGENFCPLFNNSDDFFYAEYPAWLQDYITANRPIVLGPKAPNDTYRLWRAPAGECGDAYADYHRMPAAFYLPAELYDRLPAELQ